MNNNLIARWESLGGKYKVTVEKLADDSYRVDFNGGFSMRNTLEAAMDAACISIKCMPSKMLKTL